MKICCGGIRICEWAALEGVHFWGNRLRIWEWEAGMHTFGGGTRFLVSVLTVSKFVGEYGNILATENQQAIINDVIDVKTGVYLHKLKQI